MIHVSFLKDLNLIEVTFNYNPDLVTLIKTIPGRTWNHERKSWLIPVNSKRALLETLKYENVFVSEDVLNLSQRKEAENAFTISELNSKIAYTIKTSFPGKLWIIGEVIDFKNNGTKGSHKFFKLVEKDDLLQSTIAEINVIIWENYFNLILKKINSCSKPFEIGNGIEIKILAEIGLREKTGSISLKAIDIDPIYTIGKLAEQREKTLLKLKSLGLLEKNSSLPLIPFANRIGVIASLTSAGYSDFISEIKKSGLLFHICVYNVNVQGKNLFKTFLAALEYFKTITQKLDYVVIIRGGGSSTDLIEFDNLELGIEVANFPLKILCGIGHERDKTVLDHLTLSLKTPTKVASFLIENLKNDFTLMEQMFNKISYVFTRKIQISKETLINYKSSLYSTLIKKSELQKAFLNKAKFLLSVTSKNLIASEKSNIYNTLKNIKQSAISTLKSMLQNNNRLEEKVLFHHPRQILSKGYTFITSKNNLHIKRIIDLKNIKEINIHFIDGKARGKIESVTSEIKEGKK